jgi:hypothetical protein
MGVVMEYLLRHPVHGTKTASLLLEVEEDMANGWIEFIYRDGVMVDKTDETVEEEPAEEEITEEDPIEEEVVEENPVKSRKNKPSFVE